jgi:tetratricopeptide (TPR) repeat protein
MQHIYGKLVPVTTDARSAELIYSLRRPARTLRTVAIFVGMSGACSAWACGTADGRGEAASAEQQAVAEYDLANDAFRRGRLREALGHARKAIELNEDNAEAHYLAAVILLGFCATDERSSDCRFGEAEKHARGALGANPEMREAKNTLGVILVHEGKYDDAIGVLKPLANDILYAYPENSWGNLGWAYLLRGSADEAIDALRRAVAAQPLFCVGHYRLGLAYEKKGELNLAREAFTRALDTDRPDCRKLQDAYGARARVAQKQGFKEEAQADLEHCRDLARTTAAGQRCAAQLQALQ